MGYSHVGSYYIFKNGKIHIEIWFWFRYVDCFSDTMQALKEDGIDQIEGHDRKEYLKASIKRDLEN